MVENVTQINSETTAKVGVNVKVQKHIICAKRVIIGILVVVPVKMVICRKYYLVFSDYVLLSYKNNKNCPNNITTNYIFIITFLLITIALFKAVSIYCHLIKYQAKKNIYYHITTPVAN